MRTGLKVRGGGILRLAHFLDKISKSYLNIQKIILNPSPTIFSSHFGHFVLNQSQKKFLNFQGAL